MNRKKTSFFNACIVSVMVLASIAYMSIFVIGDKKEAAYQERVEHQVASLSSVNSDLMAVYKTCRMIPSRWNTPRNCIRQVELFANETSRENAAEGLVTKLVGLYKIENFRSVLNHRTEG